jgi:hypothetical protein
MGKPTFPDQQQDSQNAAGHRIAGECNGSVKFPGLAVEADAGAVLTAGRVQVGWGVSETLANWQT